MIRGTTLLTCPVCKKQFVRWNSTLRDVNYCSQKCAKVSMRYAEHMIRPTSKHYPMSETDKRAFEFLSKVWVA